MLAAARQPQLGWPAQASLAAGTAGLCRHMPGLEGGNGAPAGPWNGTDRQPWENPLAEWLCGRVVCSRKPEVELTSKELFFFLLNRPSFKKTLKFYAIYYTVGVTALNFCVPGNCDRSPDPQ